MHAQAVLQTVRAAMEQTDNKMRHHARVLTATLMMENMQIVLAV